MVEEVAPGAAQKTVVEAGVAAQKIVEAGLCLFQTEAMAGVVVTALRSP